MDVWLSLSTCLSLTVQNMMARLTGLSKLSLGVSMCLHMVVCPVMVVYIDDKLQPPHYPA